MAGTSRLSKAQQDDLTARHREGRPDKAAMSNKERREAGLMDRRQAAEHERLATIQGLRLADRVRGPQPDDMWATGGDPFDSWTRAVWNAWERAGHYDRACDGWADDPQGNVTCTTCDEAIPVPARASA